MRTQGFMQLCLLALLSSLGSTAGAQPGGNVQLSIEHVQGNVYMISRPGGGGNIGASIGDDGVLLVDSLCEPMADSLVAAVRSVSDQPIRFLINTHVHPDHIGGNEPRRDGIHA